MGVLDLFCPKLQPRASQCTDEKQNLQPAIGLLALFEVEYDLSILMAVRVQFERSLHA
jgi:hypothetical protein